MWFKGLWSQIAVFLSSVFILIQYHHSTIIPPLHYAIHIATTTPSYSPALGITALPEDRRPDSGEIMAGGCTYYWSGRSDGSHAQGVAVAVSNKLTPMIINREGCILCHARVCGWSEPQVRYSSRLGEFQCIKWNWMGWLWDVCWSPWVWNYEPE